ncbi:DUF2798 domain-containing protein [Streptococcus sp. zg-86]|uniref:DUF2798 domain-containing protein n=1 Tax=Streptococcus zhangguiae TaxID=2664091 RepID=A0ABW9R415_9STRE|nr:MULTISPECIES: DUF2798 domain-containing protein [unclassified Streptococcus]MTB64275.1 DUF2798 domain-containing protein [Streptococcus sp. zg-86]MTB90399.1 DUF2798 domain-containing protein [Streptococcus sp. zg-36]QTH48118.1 DUF2798 domain-containing protein [Streptococcus sp. zg-86]
MPKNVKEAFLFTVLMCGFMVLGMSCWNLFLVGRLSWSSVVMGFGPAFLVAFTLDTLLVGPIAKAAAFKVLNRLPNPVKDWQKILTISGTMAFCMVSMMSLYGLIVNGVPISFATYRVAWLSNALMAFPLNFLVAGPLARLLFRQMLFLVSSRPEGV